MGVSGCGKTTIGKLLAQELKVPFFDGDDFHSPANIEKMSKGNPLNDEDRKGWLARLNELAKKHLDKGAIIACSALKKMYRDQLKLGIPTLEFIYLKGSKDEILKRVENREGHFMPSALLDSQFDTLEAPEQAFEVSITQAPDIIVKKIARHFKIKTLGNQ
jgi:carbohydrate kinase (thermoresistant glucokinase family)